MKRGADCRAVLSLYDFTEFLTRAGYERLLRRVEALERAQETGLMRDGAPSTPTPEHVKRPSPQRKRASKR